MDSSDGSVLLEREFRYPLNSWCVSLPAGLIDAGESLEEAVARELSEETFCGAARYLPREEDVGFRRC